MKKYIFLLLLFLTHFTLFAQNRNFFKLYVTNEKNEVMLIKFDGEWEIPGANYKSSQTISQFLDTMANDHGISIGGKKLRGMITFHHEIRDNPTITLYYSAKYKSGTLNTPNWGQEVKWFSFEEACKIIPYGEMVEIMKKINTNKKTLWGGAIIISYDKETSKRKGYKILEDFYKLN